MSESEKFYCLSMNGEIFSLGTHENWESAENLAQDSKLEPIWVFGEESFNDWRITLNAFHKSGV
jgi:hypothetical protein